MPFKQHSCRLMMFSSLIKTACAILMITFPKSRMACKYYFFSKIILEKYYQDIIYYLNARGKENVTFSSVCSFLLLSHLYIYPPLFAFYNTNVWVSQHFILQLRKDIWNLEIRDIQIKRFWRNPHYRNKWPR